VPNGRTHGNNSAVDLVKTALCKDSHLDFRQITEICERLEIEPQEMSATISVLSAALQDENTPLRAKLQALTILNEATYNARAVAACREAAGLQSVLVSLRDVNNKEPGDLTAENVRMLANELDRVCFMGPVTGAGVAGPSSPNRTANAHLERLEKARQKAQEMFGLSQQKAKPALEKTAKAMSSAIKKAERTFDRTADLVMQEAEKTLSTMGLDGYRIEVPDHNQTQQQRQLEQQQQPQSLQLQSKKQQERLSWEQRQLQWALQSSLTESTCCQSTSSSAAPCPPMPEGNQGNDLCMTDFYHSMGTVTEGIKQAEDRVASAEKRLADQLAQERVAATGDVDLVCRVEESSNIVTELNGRLGRTNTELGLVVQRQRELETALENVQAGLTVHSSAALVLQLREHLAKQESLLATQTAAQRQAGHAATEAVAATVPGHAPAVSTRTV